VGGPEEEQPGQQTTAPLVKGARHFIKVANHDHIVEISTMEEMSLREFIQIVKEEALDLCSSVPVVGVIEYESEQGDERRNDPSVR